MTLAQRALRGVAFVMLSSYSNMALGMVYGVVMARLLEPDDFGVFAGAMFFFTLLDLRGKLGLDHAFIHRQPISEALITTHWVLQMSAAGLTLALVALASLILPALGYSPEAWLIASAVAVIMLIESAGSTARASLEKELALGWSSIVVTSALALSYIAAVVLAVQGFGYWALVGQVAVNALTCTVGFWWARRRLSNRAPLRLQFDRDLAVWLLKFGATMAVGAIATAILLQFDNFLVLTFVGSTAAGYYVQAYKIAQWPTGLVTHVIARASLPTYARLQSDALRLSKAFELSLWAILTLALPMALALFVVAPDFVLLLYGPKWLPSAELLRYLVGYSVLRPLLDDTGALYTALGQPQRVTLVLGVQAIALVGVATPLTFQLGAIGTALGVGTAFVAGIGLMYFLISRTLTLPLARVFLTPALASLLSLGTFWGVTQIVDPSGLPPLARVLTKGGLVVSVFLVIVVASERQALVERVTFLWRILRSRPA